MNTINISIPKEMYKDIKKVAKEKRYASVSELIRAAVRSYIYPEVTENGFTREFEDMVLESAEEPIEKSVVLETDKDIENYFKKLKLPKK